VKPLQISEPASQELAEAVRWHENRRPGWGGRFFDEVIRTFGLIEAYPAIGSPRLGRLPSRQFKGPRVSVYPRIESAQTTFMSSLSLTPAGAPDTGNIDRDSARLTSCE
jgi:hypothetical protein